MPEPSSGGAKPRAWLIDEWRWVMRRSWSVRLMLIASVLSGLETTVGIMVAFSVKPPMPPGIFAAFAGLLTVAAAIARFIAQSRD